ncbi:MAG TPA: SCO1664 family protein [Dehalococcoidia bacterium]
MIQGRSSSAYPEPEGPNWSPDRPDVRDVLAAAEVVDCRLIPWGSNATFAVTLRHPEAGTGYAVYKPRRGETPLWDFPPGLYVREYAAYVLSTLLGWPGIPPTVIREGPYGVGSVQLMVDVRPDGHYFTLRERRLAELMPMAAFDVVANNADRKGGHCLEDTQGRIWGIDHGLTFHAEPKLRTVIWDFAGSAVPEPLLADLAAARRALERGEGPAAELRELLTAAETAALLRRMDDLLAGRTFPHPGPRRSYPWPLL